MKIIKKSLILAFFTLFTQFAYSDPTIINNNNGPPSQPMTQCNGNQNNIYDPRVLPEGSYVVNNSDGSANQIYTTGEKKPYYVDNNCNSNANYNSAANSPSVWVNGNNRGNGRR